ncbi:hypothetical protein ACF0H5_018565 [Mactra antiquata]
MALSMRGKLTHGLHIGIYWTCILIYINVSTLQVTAQDCYGQDQCSCAFEDGTKVMLNSLGNSDGTPKFKDIKGDDGSKYSYNPCYPFSEGQGCAQAAACELDQLGNADVIGEAQSAKFTYDGSDVIVGYSAGHGILTTTQITLKCDHSACTPSLKAAGSSGLNLYALTLTTVCACPGGCDENGPISCTTGGTAGGLSAGSLILVILATFVFIYLVGGTLFLALGRNARGTEMVPNVSFWTSLPGLIKDGFMFTLRPCTRRNGY